MAPFPTMQDVELVRTGIPAAQIADVAKALALPLNALAVAIGISPRTVLRKKSSGALLDREQSEKVLRVQNVLAKAEDVLGGRDEAVEWLRRPAFALGGAEPLSLLDTSVGEQIVVNLLGGIEHGMYQ